MPIYKLHVSKAYVGTPTYDSIVLAGILKYEVNYHCFENSIKNEERNFHNLRKFLSHFCDKK